MNFLNFIILFEDKLQGRFFFIIIEIQLSYLTNIFQ